jgi:uncharacterized protein (UPF0254 family)
MFWLLNLIPNFTIHLLVVVSVLALVATQFFSFIPFIDKYLMPIKVVSIVVLVFSVYLEGAIGSNDMWQAKVKDEQVRAAKAEAASAEANTKIAQLVLLNQQSIRDINNANRKKLEGLSAQLNNQCTINSDVINVLNNAAKNRKESK